MTAQKLHDERTDCLHDEGTDSRTTQVSPELRTLQSFGVPAANEPLDVMSAPGRDSVVPQEYALPSIGEMVGGMYRVTAELGRGAMGVVFSAIDERLRRPVAIKVIRSELFRPGFVQRFLAEAQAMARINHPHVVGIYAMGEYKCAPYFVVEHIDGQTLERWMSNAPKPRVTVASPGGLQEPQSETLTAAATQPFDLETRLRLIDEICLGVAAIHAAGAVHRDIKPSNILLDSELHAYVADFGVAALCEDRETSEVAGTLAYMAPELRLSIGERSPAEEVSDVYSLACVAHELLTGKHPKELLKVNSGVHRVEPEPSLRSELPRALELVLAEALQEDPRQRTPTVAAFHKALLEARGAVVERILIAEDDDDFRELLRETLQARFPHTELVCVGNGADALGAVDLQPPSVALIDLQMPGLDGVTLTELLRSRPLAAHMPIIVLSGSGGAAEWKHLAALGADRFLVKPVHLDDVTALIEQTLRERKGQLRRSA